MEELKVLAGDAGNEAGDADAERNRQGEEARGGDEGSAREGRRIGKAPSSSSSSSFVVSETLTTMETLTSTETLMITETTKTTDRIYNDIDL